MALACLCFVLGVLALWYVWSFSITAPCTIYTLDEFLRWFLPSNIRSFFILGDLRNFIHCHYKMDREHRAAHQRTRAQRLWEKNNKAEVTNVWTTLYVTKRSYSYRTHKINVCIVYDPMACTQCKIQFTTNIIHMTWIEMSVASCCVVSHNRLKNILRRLNFFVVFFLLFYLNISKLRIKNNVRERKKSEKIQQSIKLESP